MPDKSKKPNKPNKKPDMSDKKPMPDKTKTPNKPNKKPVKKSDMSDKPVKSKKTDMSDKPVKSKKTDMSDKPVKSKKPDLIEYDRFPLMKKPTFVRKDIYTGADIPIFI